MTRSRTRAGRWAALLAAGGFVLAGAAGCASVGVRPWEREVLARPDMRLDSHPLENAIDDHMYFSREASSGGRGFGGGGCGCN